MSWLVPGFFITAFLYASIGFGGGSTYTALLALTPLSHTLIPPISLSCNLMVVTASSIRYVRAGLVDWRECASYLVASMPAAWFAGTLHISRDLFFVTLGSALILSAVAMSLKTHLNRGTGEVRTPPLWLRFAVSVCIGFVAGLVGIGGGIFLSPVLHLLRAATPKRIAAIASVYIAANSLAGLFGHATHLADFSFVLSQGWLFVAVLIGGQLGNWLSLRWLSEQTVRTLTSLLVLYVGVRLLLIR